MWQIDHCILLLCPPPQPSFVSHEICPSGPSNCENCLLVWCMQHHPAILFVQSAVAKSASWPILSNCASLFLPDRFVKGTNVASSFLMVPVSRRPSPGFTVKTVDHIALLRWSTRTTIRTWRKVVNTRDCCFYAVFRFALFRLIDSQILHQPRGLVCSVKGVQSTCVDLVRFLSAVSEQSWFCHCTCSLHSRQDCLFCASFFGNSGKFQAPLISYTANVALFNGSFGQEAFECKRSPEDCPCPKCVLSCSFLSKSWCAHESSLGRSAGGFRYTNC